MTFDLTDKKCEVCGEPATMEHTKGRIEYTKGKKKEMCYKKEKHYYCSWKCVDKKEKPVSQKIGSGSVGELI